jgi:hypothetical protein
MQTHLFSFLKLLAGHPEFGSGEGGIIGPGKEPSMHPLRFEEIVYPGLHWQLEPVQKALEIVAQL